MGEDQEFSLDLLLILVEMPSGYGTRETEFKAKVWAEERHLEVAGIWVEFKDTGLDEIIARVGVHREKKDLSNSRGHMASEVSIHTS